MDTDIIEILADPDVAPIMTHDGFILVSHDGHALVTKVEKPKRLEQLAEEYKDKS